MNRPTLTSRRLFLAVRHRLMVAGVLLVCVSGVWGQSASTNQVGFPQNGVFDQSDFDNINLLNGNVHLDVPFYTIPGRGGVPLSVKAVIDTQGLYFKTVCDKLGNCTDYVKPEPNADMFGMVVSPFSYAATSSTTPCGGGFNNLSNVVLREPNGAKHHFVPDGCNYNYSSTGPWWQYADDGSGYRHYYNQASNTSGYYDRHGTPVGQEDSNGNFLSIDFNLTTETDTAGRTYTGCFGGSQDPTCNAYTYVDAGGTTRTITVNRTSYATTTQFCQDDMSGNVCQELTNFTAISSIVLPNNQQYTFNYATTASYYQVPDGQLISVGLPDGGTINYAWVEDSLTTSNDGPRVRVTSRTVTDGAGNSYTSSYPAYGTVIDPNGNETDVSYAYIIPSLGNGAALNVNQGPWQTDTYTYNGNGSGKVQLKLVHTDYSTPGGVLPSVVTTTLDDTEISKVSKSYDSYTDSTEGINFSWGNPIDVYEYDLGGPPSGGPLLRPPATTTCTWTMPTTSPTTSPTDRR